MRDLSLHILDVVENSLRASAHCVEIRIAEVEQEDLVSLEIADDGEGMSEEMLQRAVDPFFTGRPDKRIGLGLALLAQAAREADGGLDVSSTRGEGTRIRVTFRRSHPDRKPLGDIAATLETLIAGNPDVDFVFEHRDGADIVGIDTRGIRQP